MSPPLAENAEPLGDCQTIVDSQATVAADLGSQDIAVETSEVPKQTIDPPEVHGGIVKATNDATVGGENTDAARSPEKAVSATPEQVLSATTPSSTTEPHEIAVDDDSMMDFFKQAFEGMSIDSEA